MIRADECPEFLTSLAYSSMLKPAYRSDRSRTTNGSRSPVTDGCSMRTARPGAGTATRAAGVASSPMLPA